VESEVLSVIGGIILAALGKKGWDKRPNGSKGRNNPGNSPHVHLRSEDMNQIITALTDIKNEIARGTTATNDLKTLATTQWLEQTKRHGEVMVELARVPKS
jgi:hypothetical protein